MRNETFAANAYQRAENACYFSGLIGKRPLTDIKFPVLSEGLAYWRSLCRGRKFPVRSDVTLRGLNAMMRNAILIRVIGDGEDYEYRFVGEAHVEAHGRWVQGKRWSELDIGSGVFSRQRKRFYDEVVASGEPLLIDGYVAQHFFEADDMGNRAFIHGSTLCLPLGRDETVDHMLTITVYGEKIPHHIEDDFETAPLRTDAK